MVLVWKVRADKGFSDSAGKERAWQAEAMSRRW